MKKCINQKDCVIVQEPLTILSSTERYSVLIINSLGNNKN